jgi:hypothetical protein
VNGRRTPAAGRLARWILLSCTLFGLATMHTLGHAGPEARGHLSPAAAASAADGVTAMAAPLSRECPAGHCDSGMSGWSVCLAVLSGFAGAILLAALLSWATAGRGRAFGTASGRPTVPRGPPRRPAALTLASVAVLRI